MMSHYEPLQSLSLCDIMVWVESTCLNNPDPGNLLVPLETRTSRCIIFLVCISFRHPSSVYNSFSLCCHGFPKDCRRFTHQTNHFCRQMNKVHRVYWWTSATGSVELIRQSLSYLLCHKMIDVVIYNMKLRCNIRAFNISWLGCTVSR